MSAAAGLRHSSISWVYFMYMENLKRGYITIIVQDGYDKKLDCTYEANLSEPRFVSTDKFGGSLSFHIHPSAAELGQLYTNQ